MKEEKWKQYLAIPGAEKMQSVLQAVDIDQDIAKIPKDIKNVLCVGIGDGYELTKIPNSEGIDLNPEQVKAVQEKGLKCQVMDMHDLTFPDKSFDLIYCRNTFEHCFAPYIVLSEFARVTRKYVLLVLPDIIAWGESDWHYSILNERQLSFLGKKVGLHLYKIWHDEYIGTRNIHDGYLFRKL